MNHKLFHRPKKERTACRLPWLSGIFRRRPTLGDLQWCGIAVLTLVACFGSGVQAARGATLLSEPTSKPEFATFSDLTMLQCGNLIYAGSQSSVCFADKFLTDTAKQTNFRINKRFCPVRLDTPAVFDFPFCVMSGNENFVLSEKERGQLRRYLEQGGFLLVSPGCSDETWDKAFRREIALCLPRQPLEAIPMSHPLFSVVNKISHLRDKHGKSVNLEGLHMNGRLALVYSKDGLNDVGNAKGCCCCGGNEVQDPAAVNVNVYAYAVLY